MSDKETDRIIGAIQAMSNEHGRQLDKVFGILGNLQTTVTNMQATGCARGLQHSEEIRALRKRPADLLAFTGGSIGILVGCLTLAKYLLKF